MKRLVYTGLLMLGLLAVACQKEDIQPNTDDLRNFPSFNDHNCGNRAQDPNGRNFDPDGDGGDDGGGIVDPNGEQEGSDKPGQHNQN